MTSYTLETELSVEEYEIACATKVLNFDFYGLGTIKIQLKGKPKISRARGDRLMVKVNTDEVPKSCDFNWATNEYFRARWIYRESLKKIKEEIISELPEDTSELEKYLVQHGYENYLKELQDVKDDLHDRYEGIKKYLEK